MSDKNNVYAKFIEDCREERQRLATLVASLQEKQLGVGGSVIAPAAMQDATKRLIVAFNAAIGELDSLIHEWDRLGATG